MVTYTATPDFYNDYISHHGILGQKWGKKNGPPYPLDSKVSTGKKLKKWVDKHTITRKPKSEGSAPKYGEKRGDKIIRNPSDVIDVATEDGMKEYLDKNMKIEKDKYGYLSTVFKNLHMFGDPNIGVSEKTIKDAYIDYKKNEKKIKKLAFEAIDDDNVYDNFNFSITDIHKGTIKPLTKQEFKNALDVKSIYVTPNNGVEISIWEKDNSTSILAGHSIDIEFDLKDPKKPKYVSVNG